MTTLQQYLRRCDLNIGGMLIQETLRIVFSIKLGGDASQQPSTVRIYNLAMATASNLIEAGTPVSLQAGYADTPLGCCMRATSGAGILNGMGWTASLPLPWAAAMHRRPPYSTAPIAR